MLRVVFHELAEAELWDASTYYEAARPGLGMAFVEELERVTGLMAESPEAGRSLLGSIRIWPLQRFPYSVIYEVVGSDLLILAIANERRRPFYWQARRS